MKTTEFENPLTAAKLNESMFKKFGVKVNFDKYTREELENYRNLLRTNISQYEAKTNFNDLLTDESYQKNKHLANLLNQKIKEMLGESKKAKKDWDGDGKIESEKDEVWGSRMKAAKKSKKVKEDMKTNNVKENTGKFDKTDTTWTDKSGKKHPAQRVTRKTDQLAQGEEDKPRTATSMKSKKTGKAMEAIKAKKDYDGDGKIESPKDEVWGSRAKAAAKAGKPFKEAMSKKCCCEEKGKKACPVHGKKVDESRAIFRRHVAVVNESLLSLLQEDEEGKAKAITAASDMVNDFTTWMQRVGQYQTKSMIELADAIRAEFGPTEAETFKQSVAPALAATIETLTAQREAISHAVAVLAGEATGVTPMGSETGIDGMDAEPIPSSEDEMNMGGDDGLGADVGAGAPNSASREMRESRQHKLQEAHNIMRSLSK
jgi:hypothetical protein